MKWIGFLSVILIFVIFSMFPGSASELDSMTVEDLKSLEEKIITKAKPEGFQFVPLQDYHGDGKIVEGYFRPQSEKDDWARGSIRIYVIYVPEYPLGGRQIIVNKEDHRTEHVGNFLVTVSTVVGANEYFEYVNPIFDAIVSVLPNALSGPSDDTDSFDDVWNEYFAADFSELKRLESFIDDKKKELERAETQSSYEVDTQPVYPDGGYGETSLPSTQNIGQSYDVATINAEISRAQNSIDRINTNYNSYSKEEVSKYYSLSGDERQKITADTEELISIYKKEIDDQSDIVSEGEAELADAMLGFDYDSDDGSGMRNLGEDANDPSSTTLMKSHDAGAKIDTARKRITEFEDKILKSQSIINNLELAEKLLSASS